MKRHLGFGSLVGGCAISVLTAEVAWAQITEVTAVDVISTGTGVEVVLETSDGDRPQIFTVSRGNTLVADIINTQLSLPEGNGFVENDPAPGISSIAVTQLDANSVRITVSGETDAPNGQVSQENGTIVFNFSTSEIADADAVEETIELPTVDPEPIPAPEPPIAQLPEEQPEPEPPAQPELDNGDVLVPNPQVRIDGVEVQPRSIESSVPPLIPRAIAPPVGDIAITSIDPSPSSLNLGTTDVVPRLVLREAPVREVLSLLARAAGLNLAYVGDVEGEELDEVTISLDIENEPIQDVFNYVIRLSGLEASRFGRTIFAGPRLPNEARQLIVRNLRLNQIDVPSALNFLVGLGAETAVSRQRLVTAVAAVEVGEGAGAPITQTETFEVEELETQRVEYEDSEPLLRGLQVIGDERTNSVTLIGTARQVEIAVSQLVPLDIRRRQVAVNVRVIDVDLNAVDAASTSFSFGVGETSVIVEGGIGVVNFGDENPAGTVVTPGTIGDVVNGLTGIAPGNFEYDFTERFLAQLQVAVTNGNAKVLTDPTLVVQEGQAAEVVLADEVITNIEVETEGTGEDRTQTVTVETEPAGVILRVQVDRIDDNGFVSLSVAPTVSSPGATEEVTVEGAEFILTLLSERRLTSGQLRLRDGQTLILSGIIQDSDSTTVTKVPILGDLPIIGALFRRTNRENERREVIIVMTLNVLDDSDVSTFGYSYTPTSPEARDLLQR
ncbi:MAG: AMIN domain-containing protein [Synechococcales bacterium]|nr:AMIN domain-containing protein [Synechococcales bacterium]